MIGEQIVEHHTHYKELHGYDLTVFMTKSEHSKIDHRILFPSISVEGLAKISAKAAQRTDKCKRHVKVWCNINKENIAAHKKRYYHEKRGSILTAKKQYRIDNIDAINKYWERLRRIQFTSVEGENTVFLETVIYNNLTGGVSYSAGFYGKHGIKLPVVEVET